MILAKKNVFVKCMTGGDGEQLNIKGHGFFTTVLYMVI
jgi:hypothetical protein